MNRYQQQHQHGGGNLSRFVGRAMDAAADTAEQKQEDAKTGYGWIKNVRTVCIVASAIWWWDLHTRVMNMDSTTQYIVAGALSLGFAYAIPALSALTMPHTAADTSLIKSRLYTPGFWMCVLVTGFLILYAHFMTDAYWGGQIGFKDNPSAVFWQSWAQIALFIGVPSLTLSLTTPSRYIAEMQAAQTARLIEEDHRAQLEKRKMQHRQDLLLAEAAYVQALGVMRRGIWNASPRQIEFVTQTMQGIDRAEFAALEEMTQHLHTLTGIKQEVPLIGDDHIVEVYEDLGSYFRQMTDRYRETGQIEEGHYEVESTQAMVPASSTQAQGTQSVPGQNLDRTTAETDRRNFTEEYRKARPSLNGVWTTKQLSEVLSCSERSARNVVSRWRDLEWIRPGEMQGRYVWSE